MLNFRGVNYRDIRCWDNLGHGLMEILSKLLAASIKKLSWCVGFMWQLMARIAWGLLCGSRLAWAANKTEEAAKNSAQQHVGVSKNNGTPKSSILIGFSIINHPFWDTPILGNTHVFRHDQPRRNGIYTDQSTGCSHFLTNRLCSSLKWCFSYASRTSM